jgi:hypothetical protein
VIQAHREPPETAATAVRRRSDARIDALRETMSELLRIDESRRPFTCT